MFLNGVDDKLSIVDIDVMNGNFYTCISSAIEQFIPVIRVFKSTSPTWFYTRS